MKYLLLAVMSLSTLAFADNRLTVGQIQSGCEAMHESFSKMFYCTKQKMNEDEAMRNYAPMKLYLLKGEQLVSKINKGDITDIDAKVEWQELYVRLKSEQLKELKTLESKGDQSDNSRPTTSEILNNIKVDDPTRINCTTIGNTTNCNSY